MVTRAVARLRVEPPPRGAPPAIIGRGPLYEQPATSDGCSPPADSRNLSGSASGSAHYRKPPVDLTTLDGFCISDTAQDPPFGILSRIFTGQGGISGTREETWVYRMLWNLGMRG